jgi:hypothetical protein
VSLRQALTECECEAFDARFRKFDFEQAVNSGSRLADQLVQALFGYSALEGLFLPE